MPTPPDFPDGLTINGRNLLDASEAIGALRVFQTVPGLRGELQVVPNDGPTGSQKDPFAGGEFTVLMQDVRVTGYDNASALTIRSTRNGTTGEGVAFTIRSLSEGTGPQYPIEFDATDGTVQFKLTPDAKAWFYRQVQMEGHGDLPILRLGPSSQPAIDFEDNDAGACTYRLRSTGGSFSIYNTTQGNVPLIIDRDGRPAFLNTTTTSAPPNVNIDPNSGAMRRSTASSLAVSAALPTNGTASNAAMATLLNEMREALIGFGIAHQSP